MADQTIETEKTSAPLSIRGLNWLEPTVDPQKVSRFARETGLNEVLSTLLVSRGVQPDDVDGFLEPKLRDLCPDPSSLQDMDKAAAEIAAAILDGRKVTVFADYDVDGATSAAQLMRYFRHFDRDLGLYVPDRLKEGYGPSPEAFQSLKDDGVDLVITVDCGAAAIPALAHARDIGLPVIVLDHHLMSGALPDCLALVNPNRPDDTSGQGHMAAAGVVFILLVALNRVFREVHHREPKSLPDLTTYLDLCALGTLCDMAPLHGVNRAFVVQGLRILERDECPGILALAQVSGRSAPRSVTDLTFGIGPQLNAGGRIGDPWLATRLLATQTFDAAIPMAETLNALNQARKDVEADILHQARNQIIRKLEAHPDRKILIAAGEDWHPGVIGIVAGRLKDEFHRPVIVIGYGDSFGALAKGSARSVGGINIGDAIAAAAREGILASGGGHAMAGGLSMEPDRLDQLSDFLEELCQNDDAAIRTARNVQIQQNVLCSACNLEFVTLIEQAGPYGAGAPKPILRLRDVRVVSSRIIGQNHIKAILSDGSAQIEAIAWRCADQPLGEALRTSQVLDVIGYAQRNVWQGRDRVQFEIFDAVKIK